MANSIEQLSDEQLIERPILEENTILIKEVIVNGK